jgi:hypothetical protein
MKNTKNNKNKTTKTKQKTLKKRTISRHKKLKNKSKITRRRYQKGGDIDQDEISDIINFFTTKPYINQLNFQSECNSSPTFTSFFKNDINKCEVIFLEITSKSRIVHKMIEKVNSQSNFNINDLTNYIESHNCSIPNTNNTNVNPEIQIAVQEIFKELYGIDKVINQVTNIESNLTPEQITQKASILQKLSQLPQNTQEKENYDKFMNYLLSIYFGVNTKPIQDEECKKVHIIFTLSILIPKLIELKQNGDLDVTDVMFNTLLKQIINIFINYIKSFDSVINISRNTQQQQQGGGIGVFLFGMALIIVGAVLSGTGVGISAGGPLLGIGILMLLASPF